MLSLVAAANGNAAAMITQVTGHPLRESRRAGAGLATDQHRLARRGRGQLYGGENLIELCLAGNGCSVHPTGPDAFSLHGYAAGPRWRLAGTSTASSRGRTRIVPGGRLICQMMCHTGACELPSI